jgi:hypothetical protein
MSDQSPRGAKGRRPPPGLLHRLLPGAANLRHYQPSWVRRVPVTGTETIHLTVRATTGLDVTGP